MLGATSFTLPPTSIWQVPFAHGPALLVAATMPTAPTTVPETETPWMYSAVQVTWAGGGVSVMPLAAVTAASQPAPVQPVTR